jgi:hypothetical protein
MDDFFEKPRRRLVRELNIVPIIDMLTTVIFFLLLSTTFMEYTKLTVPPSKVSTITDPVAPPPLAPKLAFVRQGSGYRLVLSWAGATGGEISKDFQPDAGTDLASPKTAQALLEFTKAAVGEFATKFPGEKSLQLGLGRDVAYQGLIAVMDGAREKMPDVVLISYDEAEARVRGTASTASAPAGGHGP